MRTGLQSTFRHFISGSSYLPVQALWFWSSEMNGKSIPWLQLAPARAHERHCCMTKKRTGMVDCVYVFAHAGLRVEHVWYNRGLSQTAVIQVCGIKSRVEKIGPIIFIACPNASTEHTNFRKQKALCTLDKFVPLTSTSGAHDSCLISFFKYTSNCVPCGCGGKWRWRVILLWRKIQLPNFFNCSNRWQVNRLSMLPTSSSLKQNTLHYTFSNRSLLPNSL